MEKNSNKSRYDLRNDIIRKKVKFINEFLKIFFNLFYNNLELYWNDNNNNYLLAFVDKYKYNNSESNRLSTCHILFILYGRYFAALDKNYNDYIIKERFSMFDTSLIIDYALKMSNQDFVLINDANLKKRFIKRLISYYHIIFSDEILYNKSLQKYDVEKMATSIRIVNYLYLNITHFIKKIEEYYDYSKNHKIIMALNVLNKYKFISYFKNKKKYIGKL